MLLIGLSGGIGAGKSLACEAFARAGAEIIDSDLIARDVVAVGTPGLTEIQLRFGHEVLNADGSLNRTALANIVFTDESARADLERITHPRIVRIFQERVQQATPGTVIVHDVPLLVETGAQDRYQLVVMIEASMENRLTRLEKRGLSPELAKTRMQNQASDEERRKVADIVLNNDGPDSAIALIATELMEHRFLPFAAHLAAGTAAQPGHHCPNELSAEEVFERVLERVNAISPATHFVENIIEINNEDDAFLRMGFVHASGGYTSCDPGRVVRLRTLQ
jgi:dephospho-CoA kinase